MIFRKLKELFTFRKKVDKKSLERLLEDIEAVHDAKKAEEFKTIVKSQNMSNIYNFMSEII